jgi:Asp-tRNA(Asn)/Glu-tRNA(Gln) amidotransferase C subunit
MNIDKNEMKTFKKQINNIAKFFNSLGELSDGIIDMNFYAGNGSKKIQISSKYINSLSNLSREDHDGKYDTLFFMIGDVKVFGLVEKNDSN